MLEAVSHFRRRTGIQGTSDTRIYRETRLNVIIYIPLAGLNGSGATHQFAFLSFFFPFFVLPE